MNTIVKGCEYGDKLNDSYIQYKVYSYINNTNYRQFKLFTDMASLQIFTADMGSVQEKLRTI